VTHYFKEVNNVVDGLANMSIR